MSAPHALRQSGCATVTARELLERAAVELAASATRLDLCQGAVSAILPRDLPSDLSEALQGLDAATQTTVELAVLLGRLSECLGHDKLVDANLLLDIRLSDLRDRLAGVATDDAPGWCAARPIELW